MYLINKQVRPLSEKTTFYNPLALHNHCLCLNTKWTFTKTAAWKALCHCRQRLASSLCH